MDNTRQKVKDLLNEFNSYAPMGVGEDTIIHFTDEFTGLLSNKERELKQKLNPEYPDLLPVLTKEHEWYKAHEAMGAEIVFDTIYDHYDGERKRPIRAIYYSPVVKFQEVMKPHSQ